MKKYIILLLFIVLGQVALACTTAVITGRASRDGRPLLYKQRDSGFLDNKVMLFKDGLYTYIGIVNSEDKEGKEVWGGHNQVGFAIMNSASYNLNAETKEEKPELEGVVMKLALQECRTLKDFENLLDTFPRPMHLSANFGVIDAEGGAAYYETSDYEYKKYDANETEDGYLLRTNFSYSGERERDLGLSRCEVATQLFEKKFKFNDLSYTSIFQDISRSLQHGIMDMDLNSQIPKDNSQKHFVSFRDFIPRYSTTSSIVIEGVKENESTDLTVMWTILGSPLTSVAMPLLIVEDGSLPQIVLADDTEKAPLCTWSLNLKKKLFPITRGEGKDYLDLAQLITQDNQGILQKVKVWENEIAQKADKYFSKWRKEGEVGSNYKELYEWIDAFLKEKYSEELDTNKPTK